MVLRVKLTAPTVNRDAAADDLDDPDEFNDSAAVRWAHFPGERLLQKTQFEVNGNPLDEYTWNVYNMYREFQVQPNKEDGWFRNVGQELPQKGFLRQPGVKYSSSDSDVTSWESVANHRVCMDVCSGAQTPKATQEDLDLFIPLLFWFNKDPRLAIPSVAIPYGQRFINITLADQDSLIGVVPRGSGTYATPLASLGNVNVSKIELLINNIFVNPEVHDIFIKRIGFTLIRVHREQTFNADKDEEQLLLSSLKWPTEAIFVGMRIREYNSSNAAEKLEHLDKWHTFSQVTNTDYEMHDVTGNQVTPADNAGMTDISIAAATGVVTVTGASNLDTLFNPGDIADVGGWVGKVLSTTDGETMTIAPAPGVAKDNSGGALGLYINKYEDVNVNAPSCADTLDTLKVTAHGIPLYQAFPFKFYNSYLPFRFGGPNVRTPKGACSGVAMIPFCLYPGTYQPSGHINISRAREFFLTYTSSVISSSVLGTLVIVACAINFLLISDGSAVLRYST